MGSISSRQMLNPSWQMLGPIRQMRGAFRMHGPSQQMHGHACSARMSTPIADIVQLRVHWRSLKKLEIGHWRPRRVYQKTVGPANFRKAFSKKNDGVRRRLKNTIGYSA